MFTLEVIGSNRGQWSKGILFLGSCLSVVMKDAIPLTPPAHEWNTLFKCKEHTIHDHFMLNMNCRMFKYYIHWIIIKVIKYPKLFDNYFDTVNNVDSLYTYVRAYIIYVVCTYLSVCKCKCPEFTPICKNDLVNIVTFSYFCLVCAIIPASQSATSCEVNSLTYSL